MTSSFSSISFEPMNFYWFLRSSNINESVSHVPSPDTTLILGALPTRSNSSSSMNMCLNAPSLKWLERSSLRFEDRSHFTWRLCIKKESFNEIQMYLRLIKIVIRINSPHKKSQLNIYQSPYSRITIKLIFLTGSNYKFYLYFSN